MGNYLSSPPCDANSVSARGSASISGPTAVSASGSRGLKRSHSDSQAEADDDSPEHLSGVHDCHDALLNTPKRRKLTTTSDYIYDTLFKNGENSDVTIHALGKEWKLHKLYLCQSGYFSSMFNRSWKESDQNYIHLDIPDDNIDVQALDITFGSLYRDDVLIKPAVIVQVLAAATLLSLEGLIQQCASVMTETISSKTVCDYHTASIMYGQVALCDACKSWLERNLLISQAVDLLREIDTELMTEVVGSSQLFVMQVEMDVYSMLKKWLFLQFHPSWEGSLKDLLTEAEAWFRTEGATKPDYLSTDRGRPYTGPFRALRLCHIINDFPSTKILESDCIIPKAWLLPIYRRQWLQMLRVEQGHDTGPDRQLKKLDEKFSGLSLRLGRILQKDGQYCWRWTGYNFGIDVLVSYSNRLLFIKRNTLSHNFPGATSMQDKRSLLFSMKVCSLNKLGQVIYEKSTGIKQLSLSKDQEQVIMCVDRKVEFPLHISCYFMTHTPRGQGQSSSPCRKACDPVMVAVEQFSDESSDDGGPSDGSHDDRDHGNNPGASPLVVAPAQNAALYIDVDDNAVFS